jgi:hypothetical protein
MSLIVGDIPAASSNIFGSSLNRFVNNSVVRLTDPAEISAVFAELLEAMAEFFAALADSSAAVAARAALSDALCASVLNLFAASAICFTISSARLTLVRVNMTNRNANILRIKLTKAATITSHSKYDGIFAN